MELSIDIGADRKALHATLRMCAACRAKADAMGLQNWVDEHVRVTAAPPAEPVIVWDSDEPIITWLEA